MCLLVPDQASCEIGCSDVTIVGIVILKDERKIYWPTYTSLSTMIELIIYEYLHQLLSWCTVSARFRHSYRHLKWKNQLYSIYVFWISVSKQKKFKSRGLQGVGKIWRKRKKQETLTFLLFFLNDIHFRFWRW